MLRTIKHFVAGVPFWFAMMGIALIQHQGWYVNAIPRSESLLSTPVQKRRLPSLSSRYLKESSDESDVVMRVLDHHYKQHLPPLSSNRGGAVSAKNNHQTHQSSKTTLQKIFSPGVALKVLSVGMLPVSLILLFAPKKFVDINFKMEGNPVSEVMELFWGNRELLVSLLAWFISESGTEQLCRVAVTLAFLILSPAQIFSLLTSDAIDESARPSLVALQIVYGIYLGTTTIVAWSNRDA